MIFVEQFIAKSTLHFMYLYQERILQRVSFSSKRNVIWEMAHLQPTHVSITTKLFIESNCGFRWGVRDGKAKRTELARSWKPPCRTGRISEGNKRFTRIFSTDQAVGMLETSDGYQINSGSEGINDHKFYLVEEHGWKVRRMVEEGSEMRKVANIQAEAFHEPVALFDDFFLQFFQAEVLSALLYRLKNSPSDRYACLVAVPGSSTSDQQDELVGVVDVTVLRDRDVIEHLAGTGDYLYVSGIAVSIAHRRKKVATALLKACEAICVLWGYKYLALRAYEDDWGARTLYENAGYRVVSGDAPWFGWVGRKRRILMIKQCLSCKLLPAQNE